MPARLAPRSSRQARAAAAGVNASAGAARRRACARCCAARARRRLRPALAARVRRAACSRCHLRARRGHAPAGVAPQLAHRPSYQRAGGRRRALRAVPAAWTACRGRRGAPACAPHSSAWSREGDGRCMPGRVWLLLPCVPRWGRPPAGLPPRPGRPASQPAWEAGPQGGDRRGSCTILGLEFWLPRGRERRTELAGTRDAIVLAAGHAATPNLLHRLVYL
jgi:hypothetical protein